MKFFRIDLLTLLISLFILNSCKNEDTIGLKARLADSLSGSLVDTATVFTNTTTDDSVVTSGITKVPLGFTNDPMFGTTEADMITDLNLPLESAYTVPTGSIVIDSALLILKYADGFYGDSTTNCTANVYQLTQRQTSGQTYYNTTKFGYNNDQVLGSLTFAPHPIDSIKITDIVNGGKDTLLKVPGQIRIPINPSFIKGTVFNSGFTSSNLIFKNQVKGFYVSIDQTKSTGYGNTMMFKSPGDSSLAVYVRVTNGSVVDTSIVYLDITQHASYIKHTYNQQIQAALNHTKPSDPLVYIQGLAGLRAKITFPYVADSLFKQKNVGNSTIIINRAELVLTAQPGSDIPSYLVPLPKLTLYRYDISHQPVSVEDGNSASKLFTGVGEFGGFYNKTSRSYHFLVTSYIQDLVLGRTVDYGTYVGAVDTTNTSTVDIAPTPETAARSVLGGNDKTSGFGVKLNVIYTKTSVKK